MFIHFAYKGIIPDWQTTKSPAPDIFHSVMRATMQPVAQFKKYPKNRPKLLLC